MAKKTKAADTDLAAKAKEIATQQGVKVVYANDKGEFFTVKNYALISVSGKEDQLQTFDFGNAAEETEDEANTAENE